MQKTIVFCATEDHAERMRIALNNLNADMVKENPDYVVRITGSDTYGKPVKSSNGDEPVLPPLTVDKYVVDENSCDVHIIGKRVEVYDAQGKLLRQESLKKVSLPANYFEYIAGEISSYSFRNCTSLPKIILDGYWIVEEGAFMGCTSLEKVVFNENIVSIGDYALGYVENEDGTYSRYDGLTIYGVSGTAAETYAIENDIPFVNIAVSGDANGDGEFSVADLVTMQKWLLGSGGISNWKAVDFRRDDNIDVADLCLMRKALFINN